MQRTSSPLAHVLRVIAMVLSFSVGLQALAAAPASAQPEKCNPADPDCDPVDPLPEDPPPPIPYETAKSLLDYRLDDRAGGWKQAWQSADHKASKPWGPETYDPTYAHPTTFGSHFANQCVDAVDFDNERNKKINTVNTYKWYVDGLLRRSLRTCFDTALPFNGEGIHTVRLDVVSSTGVLKTSKSRTIEVVDHLVVLFGDSMASGEGAPEKDRKAGDEFGTWVDRRCHRSSWAAVPQAVQDLETSDPHSTVTFLNFACSGATIGNWVPGSGSGVLGPYNGIEPIHEFDADDEAADPSIKKHFLPSQVDQLRFALGVKQRFGPSGAPARTVDKLFISGGINDVHFADLATVCTLYQNCKNLTSPLYGGSFSSAQHTFDNYASAIPGYFMDLDKALADKGIVTEPNSRFAMQYPDPFTKDSTGAKCTSMLSDVLPTTTVHFILDTVATALIVMAATVILLPLATILATAIAVTITVLEFALGLPDIWSVVANGYTGGLEWAPDEIAWLSGQAMPLLGAKVAEGAGKAGFSFVSGIQELFKGHGYCAKDNWVNRARQSSNTQGPYDFISSPLGLQYDLDGIRFGFDIHARTKGTIHPNRNGYKAVGKHLAAHLADLKSGAPVTVVDSYEMDLATTTSIDSGIAGGVLANDFDPDGNKLTASLLTAPANGTATLSSTGRLQYTPKAGFEGYDSLTYRAYDGTTWSTPTTVYVKVYDSVGPAWSWALPLDLQAPLGDSITFPVCTSCAYLKVRADSGPTMGSLTFDSQGDDWFATYTPKQLGQTLPAIEHLVIVIGTSKDVGHFDQLGAKEVPITIVAPNRSVTWTHPEVATTLIGREVVFPLCSGCGGLQPVASPVVGPTKGKVAFVRNGDTAWNVVYSASVELSDNEHTDAFDVEIGTLRSDGTLSVAGTTRLTVSILPPPR